MNWDQLPLLELFTQLREAGLPLGIPEYQLLLRALQSGFGVRDRMALRRLCLTLWIKSRNEVDIFDYHFEQVMAQMSQSQKTDDNLRALERILKGNSTEDEEFEGKFKDQQTSENPNQSSAASTSEFTIAEDEIEVAKALQQANARDSDLPANYFRSTDEYFPVTRRQMKQSWRYLRRLVREGPPVELDVEATVEEIGRQGMLLQPIMKPPRVNRIELLLLADRDGSMVPFHALSRRLVETAVRGGRLGGVRVYYFQNCPVEYLYHDPYHVEAEPINQIVSSLSPERTSVLFFSDGGAARGRLNFERVEATENFLRQLKQKVRYLAWLNPMPRERWWGTTAGEIAGVVPMFELTRRGMDEAIAVLRGQQGEYQGSIHV